jgi:hypothetical protein
MVTEKTVFVTESDYRTIQQWEEEGGSPVDIVYVIIADDGVEQDSTQ